MAAEEMIMSNTHRPVTGPDGDNPISVSQLQILRRDSRYIKPRTIEAWRVYTDAQVALGELSPGGARNEYKERRAAAHARCAAAWNARRGAAS